MKKASILRFSYLFLERYILNILWINELVCNNKSKKKTLIIYLNLYIFKKLDLEYILN